MKIIIDTKGSDKGPAAIVKGAALALEKYEDLSLVLAGNREVIAPLCAENGINMERAEILEAPDEVTNFDAPSEAVFKKPNASMMASLRALGEREDLDGMITSGNTGAVLSGCVRYLSTPERVRPALAALLPAENGTDTCLVDTGATVDCTPQMLHHFARLGSKFMQTAYRIDRPKVGLLSNGAEPTKGNKLVKETHALLAADESLNFIGNVEGNIALSGVCDVLVCDGFAGNQVMKVTEGTFRRIITEVMMHGQKTGSRDVLALGKALIGKYDLSALGGGYILGIRKPVIKARGNSGEQAIVSICGMLQNLARHKKFYEQ
ncbi:MAG: hypothetical protein IJU28_00225 [Clostridia bacterium]|nr:hypothetical protein [Clostridia bacterium]